MKRATLCAVLIMALNVSVRAAKDSSSDQVDPQMIPIKPKSSADEAVQGLIPTPTSLIETDTMIIDAPTAATLDPGIFAVQSRFYSGGGLLQYVSLGVFNGLNIGASMSGDGLVGNAPSIGLRTPQAQIKYRFYDGNRYMPALAIGYDGQGYDYNRVTHSYNEPGRGFYLVGSRELGLPGLEIHPSINVSNVNPNAVFGALPLTYTIKNKVALLVEWDNIHNFVDSRVNLGLRFYVTTHLEIDIAARGVGQGGYYSDGVLRGPERIVQLRYIGNL
jgi:hypothetical protein